MKRRSVLSLGGAGLLAAIASRVAAHEVRCRVDQPEFTGIGKITLTTPPDLSLGAPRNAAVKDWVARNRGQAVELIELSPSADDQHAQLISELQEGSGAYDVVGIDVIWTEEFVRNHYLLPLNPETAELNQPFLPAPLKTARYRQTCLGWPEEMRYAVPLHTNVGLLYYRNDFPWAESSPTTWSKVEDYAKRYRDEGLDGFVGQLDSYEGLVVNLAEAIWGHGGVLVDGDGRAAVKEDDAIRGLDFLIRGLREEWIPEAALGFREEESRLRFFEGKAGLLRNWPYAYAHLEQEESPVKGKFDVVALPGHSALGGANLAVTTSCQNRTTALRLLQHLTTKEVQRESFADGGYPPSVETAYTLPENAGPNAQPPVPDRLRKAIDAGIANARERPRTPYYSQVSQVIQSRVHRALRESHNPGDTMAELHDLLNEALEGR